MAPFELRCAAARCRSCNGMGLLPVLDFGRMPLSDGFRSADDNAEEPRESLALAYCPECGLAQLIDVLDPTQTFGPDYLYLSSVSAMVAEAARVNANELVSRYGLGSGSLVVELACNDGYLLGNFAARGIAVLGIEPAPVPAAAARKAGIDVDNSFFSAALARELAARRTAPDLIVANNVVAHVPDPNDFVAGIATLLRPGGAAVVEVHSLASLVARNQFDTIYHEHASYFSATSISALFRRHGLGLVDVEELRLQGGSLRLHFSREGAPSLAVKERLTEEARPGTVDAAALQAFASRVGPLIEKIRSVLLEFSSSGKTVAAYGAAAKGTMLLNHLNVDVRVVRYVVDRNPHKQGRWVPGVKIPVVAPEQMIEDPPAAIIILPWNLRDEIVPILEPLRQQGTRVIVPLPEVEIL